MTTDREFDRIAMAWLADGPAELSDRVLDAVVDEIHLTRQRRAPRVPWRFPPMTMQARVVALIAIGALIIAGVAVVGGVGRGQPSPSPSRAADASSAPTTLGTIGIPVLDTPFTSTRNGYTMKVPSAWTVEPATRSWQHGAQVNWGDPALDVIKTTDARFVAAAQPLAMGETVDQWLKAYCLGAANDIGQCDTIPATWEEIKIAGTKAYVDLDGIPASGGTIAPGGKIFDAVVVAGNGAYAFTLDGDVDRAMFDAFLATIKMAPASVISLPELSGTFTSPTYGYSIGTSPSWKTTPAQHPWVGVDNESPAMDGIDITGTDTSFSAASQALGDQTYDGFLEAFHANTLKGVPNGCDGGEPSTWPPVQVGDQTGALEQLCNAAEVLVHVGDRVYVFDWGNETFDSTSHLNFASWKELLKTMRFDPSAAK